MPYKDLEHKRAWEQRHLLQRLARRRELRRAEAARKATQPEAPGSGDSAAGFLWLPITGGVAMASYSPSLAMGAGGLTLLTAALYKKDWKWWIVGIFVFALGLFFQWNNKKEKK